MKSKLTIFILLFALATSAQQIRDVYTAEYRADFLGTDSIAYAAYWVNGIGSKLVPLSTERFADGDAGLYAVLFRKANGNVYRHDIKAPSMVVMQYDTLAIPFKALHVECHLQSYYAVRQDGTIWMAGYNSGKQFSTDPQRVLTKWGKIPGQPAVRFRHITKGGANGNGVLVATTENGEVWTVNDGSTTWLKKSLPGPVQKVLASVNNFYIALIGGQPYGWGTAKYLNNGIGSISTYVPLGLYWGLTAPVKDVAVNDHTIHFITADGRLFGYGDNAMGEVGNGYELVNQYYYKGKRYVWNWESPTVSTYQQIAFVSKPEHILPGKLFKRVWAGGYYSFYWYTEDIDGNIYSCGRNKSAVLSNGVAIGNEGDLPNWGDVKTPTIVYPFKAITPLPTLFVPGKVFAGRDTSIATSTITLRGSATPSGSKAFTYPIIGWEWNKISGPAGEIILHTASGVAQVTGLTTGTYSFEVKVTDSETGTMVDTVVVNVTIVNKPPTVNAYCKTTIGNSIILVCKATDNDGKITATEWDKLTGPAGDSIIDLNTDAIEISFSTSGEYIYRFSAFDDDGASNFIDVTLIVYKIDTGGYIIMRKN